MIFRIHKYRLNAFAIRDKSITSDKLDVKADAILVHKISIIKIVRGSQDYVEYSEDLIIGTFCPY